MKYNLTTLVKSKISNKNYKKRIFYGYLPTKEKKLLTKSYIFFEKISSISEKKDNYKKCEEIYNRLLPELSKELNKIHNYHYKKKYWKIVFGRWLFDYISIVFKNYKYLDLVLKKEKINKIFLKTTDDSLFVTDHPDQLLFKNFSHEWNSDLNSRILIFLNKKAKLSFFKKSSYRYETKHSPKKNFLKQFFLKLLSFSNKKNNNYFFFQTGISFFLEKFIEFKVSGKISRWIMPTLEQNTKIDYDLRKKINLNYKSKYKVEDFIKQNIKIALPKFVIENFKLILLKLKKTTLPTKPKIIFTTFGVNNVFFNVYAANKILEGSKYVLLQHGNTSLATHYEFKYLAEAKTQDYFITWGVKKNKNQIPLFNIKSKKNNFSYNQEGNLSIILNNHFSSPRPYDVQSERNLLFFNTVSLVNKLEKKVKSKTYFRFFPKDFNNEHEYFKKILKEKNINYYSDNFSYKKVLNFSKLTLFNYDSTGFFENLVNKFPSIYFSKNPLIDLNQNYKKFYERLIDAKIIFYEEAKLINHIEKVWNNIENWWHNNKTLKAINYFNNSINIPHEQNFNKLVKILKKI